MSRHVLERPTLILNRSWQPIQVSTVSRALVLVWNGTAVVVDPTDYQTYDWQSWTRLKADSQQDLIRTANLRLRAPEVVTLTAFDRRPVLAVAFSRRNVFQRDRYMCQYCGKQPGRNELTIDHVVPRAQGGQSQWDNCVLACTDCNKRKAARTPAQAGLRLLRVPAAPRWNPLYSLRRARIDRWAKFVSEAYWDVPLES